MSEGLGKGLRITIVAAGIAALAACATPAPPPPPTPPPPPAQVVVIPPRPLPPVGAVDHMTIPAHGMDGRYLTVNTGISSAQTLWNLRSGLNVAALNCQGIEHAAMVDNYKILLNRHSRELARANTALATEFRKEHGSSFRNVQDSYMTRVYNYFALPTTMPQFCDVALEVSREVAQLAPGGLEQYSVGALPRLEAVFEGFFRTYEQYRVDLAAWDSRYGASVYAAYGPGYQAAAQPVVQLDAQYRQAASGGGIEPTDPPASGPVDSSRNPN
ncbi:MAG: hypothetical protein A3J40_06935 [Erythrobacter sp. RIFCSPHIGHO2_12_FULL_63_10]|nr:MAG: hypothetical protein A3J40_06935 [Erythrobacter sp. RIFCSPHIGHO2_12_FULL_63_10]